MQMRGKTIRSELCAYLGICEIRGTSFRCPKKVTEERARPERFAPLTSYVERRRLSPLDAGAATPHERTAVVAIQPLERFRPC